MNKSLMSTGAVILASTLALFGAAPAFADEDTPPAAIEVAEEAPAVELEAPVEVLIEEELPPVVEEAPLEAPAPVEVPVELEAPSDNEPAEEEEAEEEEEPVDDALLGWFDLTSTADSVVVSFEPRNESSTFASYRVSVSGNGYFDEKIVSSVSNVSFTGLAQGSNYIVTVTANDGGVAAFITIDFTTDWLAPERPLVTGAELLPTGINVNFNAGSNEPGPFGPTSYYNFNIETGDGELVSSELYELSGEASADGLAPGYYRYVVEAYGPGGGASTGGEFMVLAAPAAPTASIFTITHNTISGAVIPQAVNAVDTALTPLTHYTVRITAPGEAPIQLNYTQADPNSWSPFTVENLKADLEYSVTVEASNIAGASADSTPVSFVTLSAPVIDEDTPGLAPVAPNSDNFNNDTRGGIVTTPEVAVNGTIIVNVGVEYAGQTINGWLFSDPMNLGSAVVNADGFVSFTIPDGAPAGAHRLAVTDANDDLIGWANVTVTKSAGTTPVNDGIVAPVVTNPVVTNIAPAVTSGNDVVANDKLAETGGTSTLPLGALALGLLAAGGLMMVRRNRATV